MIDPWAPFLVLVALIALAILVITLMPEAKSRRWKIMLDNGDVLRNCHVVWADESYVEFTCGGIRYRYRGNFTMIEETE